MVENSVEANRDGLWSSLLRLRRESAAGDVPGTRRLLWPGGEAELPAEGGWRSRRPVSAENAALLDLYADIAVAGSGRPMTVAHLGQSLDGRIATEEGDSYYVTGPENLNHLHRMRALADAVLIGAGTLLADDPRLTVRRVTGPNPLRVVVWGRAELPARRLLFSDGQSRTLLLHSRALDPKSLGQNVETVALPAGLEGLPDLKAALALLHGRGLHVLFVEGGGRLISGFLQAGLLDRLQITVAPLIIGSGRPSITLPAVARMGDVLRLRVRRFPMGEDLLFDAELRTPAEPADRGGRP
jgi:diaminohydroxyphosphoribosylaminopyrimidine deaminase/5-amino-6-(5-phosphoribosylamino)uracil reductase